MQIIRKISTRLSDIWLDEEGFLRVKPKQGVADIDLEETVDVFEAYRELGCHENKALQIIDARENFTMSREARDYSARQVKHYIIATAVLANSLPIRMIVNFFNSFYKVKVPLQMFATEEEAKAWLRSYREEKIIPREGT